MVNSDGKFRHESLQDRKAIKTLLEALTKGIAKGELNLSDDNGDMTLAVSGLLNLRIKAERSDGQCRVDLRIGWSEDTPQNREISAPTIR